MSSRRIICFVLSLLGYCSSGQYPSPTINTNGTLRWPQNFFETNAPAIIEAIGTVSGVAGDNGWSPVLAAVSDGERRVLQVADWTGGQGTKPATGGYIGPSGLTGTIGSAVDIRGAIGATGAQGPTGATGATGAQGPQGIQGATGAQGPQGIQGATGATGSTGSQGPAGIDGERWHAAGGTPGGGLGVVGDWFLNLSNGDIYEKTGTSSWSLSGNLKGPQGDPGADGADGADGATGPAGPGVPDGGTTGQVLAKSSNSNQDTVWVDPTGASGEDPWSAWDSWEIKEWVFGGDSSALALEPGLKFTAISSGVGGTTAGLSAFDGDNGYYIRTASGTATSTGGFVNDGANTKFLSARPNQWKVDISVNRTNGAVYRFGYGDSTSTAEPTDALQFVLTNDVICGLSLANTIKATTATTFQLQKGPSYKLVINQTNDFAHFQVLSNVLGQPPVLVYEDSIGTGIPLGSARVLGLSIGGFNTAQANTNSTELFYIGHMAQRKRK